MMSYIIKCTPCKGCYKNCTSIIKAFWCGRVKTIRIRYVWTRIFSKTKKKISVFINDRILVDEASFYVRSQVFQIPQFSIHFNLLQFCPSVPSFIYAVLLIPSFNVLSGYFMFRKKFDDRSPRMNYSKFRDNKNTKQHHNNQ